MKRPSNNAILFNGAALLIVAASGVMVLRSLIFHDDAPPCADRYARGSQFAIESNGQAMAVGELQSRLSGSDWGLIESARVVKLKSGPAPYAIEYALAKTGGERPGVGFTWAPAGFNEAQSACLGYSVYVGDDFDYGRGGRLPGLYGMAKDATEAAEPEFSTRYTWLDDGRADIYTHIPVLPAGRSLGNERGGFTLPKGRWVSLEQEVVLNDPGQKNGLIRVWVDGQLRFQKSNVVFRDASGPSATATLTGVLSEVVMPGDQPGDKQKIWISPFELRWQ
jgi:hypothetical protein